MGYGPCDRAAGPWLLEARTQPPRHGQPQTRSGPPAAQRPNPMDVAQGCVGRDTGPGSHHESAPMVTDPNERLTDATLADEIALLGDVLAAATDADRRLTPAELDQALGLARAAHQTAG